VAGLHTWNPSDYARHSASQESWARDCMARLALRGNERVLDIGCGDGRVSADLAALVPHGGVLAVDASREMIAHARARHLGDGAGRRDGRANAGHLDFAVADAVHLPYTAQFDLVVSFNCLHWVHDQPAVLAGVARALVPGGRMFLHFGGQGNVAGMLAVVREVSERPAWRAAFTNFAFPWCFPEPTSYHRLVEEAGLVPERVELLCAQMSHAGAAALAGWLRTTWLPYLHRLPEKRRGTFVDEVVDAYLAVRASDEQGRIWVDAVRLEAEARRQEHRPHDSAAARRPSDLS
jgi:trans-aconitate methyltransferase